ncbi:MAG TPA: hypothetical protein VKA68_17570 [bacterium]|nr:hypothetical protein [bacterium]
MITFAVMLCITLPTYSQQDFQEWLRQQQASFSEFKDKRDKAFTQFLQKDWEEFQAMQGMVRDSNPKPDEVPQADTGDLEPPEEDVIPKIREIEVPRPTPAPEVKPEADIPREGTPLRMAFYGTELRFSYDETIRGAVGSPVDNKAISAYWEKLGKSDYEPQLEQLRSYREQLGLNDWGYAVLIYDVGRAIYPDSPNTCVLFTWFHLLKSDYNAQVGYGSGQVYLLLPSMNTVFDVPFLTLSNRKYFIIPLDGRKQQISQITTYEGDYPGTERVMDFSIRQSPVVKNTFTRKTFRFQYRDASYNLPVQINRNVVDFYALYPQTDIPIYFGARVSDATNGEILTELRRILEGKSETQAVNILLSFVQTAFDYQTDQTQFGRENYLFPEETLYYPASDCEDRAALFAYLVRQLLGLDVIGLDYPGHIATAVKFSTDVGRSSVRYRGETYTVCDPTYINAEYGMVMPSAKNKKVSIFQIP